MAVRVNVGLTKKIGLPHYGSAGASCNLEFELESSQFLEHPDTFQRQLQDAYGACRAAVQAELERKHQTDSPSGDRDEPGEAVIEPPPEAPGSTGSPGSTTTPATLGIVHASPLASQRQINYIHHLAQGTAGLTPRRLEILSATICGKRLAHLTTADASQLIDTLKDIQSGHKNLSAMPQEASA